MEPGVSYLVMVDISKRQFNCIKYSFYVSLSKDKSD